MISRRLYYVFISKVFGKERVDTLRNVRSERYRVRSQTLA